uniref:Ribonuclease 3 n=1 Tax=Leptobrachium leishanense TaxID=445787 RepID=A0A8C5MTC4_9ANUR
MSVQPSQGAAQGGCAGPVPPMPIYTTQNATPTQPQQTSTQYCYNPPNVPPPPPPPPPPPFSNFPNPSYIPPRPNYMSYPPPFTPATQNTSSQSLPRPPFPVRQGYPIPPFPPPPVPASGTPASTALPGMPCPYPYVLPPVMPPPPIIPPPFLPHTGYQPTYPGYPPHPFPPPVPPPAQATTTTSNFTSYQLSPPSYQTSSHYGQSSHSQYMAAKTQSDHRGSDRGKHYEDHRHREYSHSDRHRSEKHGDRRVRGRSLERIRRQDSSRHRSEYTRSPSHSRTPPRHSSYDRSRERHRHRESRRSLSLERSSRKRPKSPSAPRGHKRPRWGKEDKECAAESPSSAKEKSYTSSKDKEFPDESPLDRNEEEDEELLKPVWVRCTHSENYYSSDPMDQVGDSTVVGTSRLRDLYDKFEEELGKRQTIAKTVRPPWEPPKTKLDERFESSDESDCDTDDSCSTSSDSEVIDVIAEIKRKKAHPDRLHEELWYNDIGQMNDGPLCKCSVKARRTGIRHSIYPGEEPIKPCRAMTNNAGRLFHYRITVSPPTNFLTDRPTVIEYDDHEYIFEGFSLFSHSPLSNECGRRDRGKENKHYAGTAIPLCKVIRFNIDYTIHFIEEMMPEHFCVKGLELFSSYLFRDILELHDWNLIGPSLEDDSPACPQFHFMPRFVRFLPDGGKEVLSMHQVLLYLLRSNKPLVPEEEIANMLQLEELEWQKYAEECKGMIVSNPGMKPSSVRIDQLDREQFNAEVITFPIIVHFGIRPAQLSYAGDPQYQKLWKSYVKLRHLLANSPKVKQADKQKLVQREEALQKIRQKNTMRREVTVELSSQGFWKTGIRSDVCQLAMTHPSHHLNFGMNPDHARNSLSNCGIRQPKYGDRKVHHMYMRKKGINTLINIMSRLGQDDPTPSRINHNERLEFLGDAVVEFLTSVHLYYLFPTLEEGGLATYRTAIVQNQHLALLAKKLELDRYMLYAHGPDLCRESDLRHAMANCFEALMGAVYLAGGLAEAKQLFGRLLFNNQELRDVWLNYPLHPLQLQEPHSDRQLIETSPVLKKLTAFEEAIGVNFAHIRLLARAFTLRTVGFNHLTLGHNQRMEFLGDSIMQLVATEYLFIHFPDHHEGHLTLLRSSLVNNRTQAKVAEELGMQEFAITNDKTKRNVGFRTKTLADLLESFIAALYIDKDLDYVHTFMNVCFFPRLKEFILNQDWNDPKSQLQQCCLTLRTEGKEPDIPLYKTLQTVGPSHARTYTVAVYFKGDRIGCGKGPSIQQAEMGAAVDALEKYNFPQMAHQKRFIERKYRQELREMRLEKEQQELKELQDQHDQTEEERN